MLPAGIADGRKGDTSLWRLDLTNANVVVSMNASKTTAAGILHWQTGISSITCMVEINFHVHIDEN